MLAAWCGRQHECVWCIGALSGVWEDTACCHVWGFGPWCGWWVVVFSCCGHRCRLGLLSGWWWWLVLCENWIVDASILIFL